MGNSMWICSEAYSGPQCCDSTWSLLWLGPAWSLAGERVLVEDVCIGIVVQGKHGPPTLGPKVGPAKCRRLLQGQEAVPREVSTSCPCQNFREAFQWEQDKGLIPLQCIHLALAYSLISTFKLAKWNTEFVEWYWDIFQNVPAKLCHSPGFRRSQLFHTDPTHRIGSPLSPKNKSCTEKPRDRRSVNSHSSLSKINLQVWMYGGLLKIILLRFILLHQDCHDFEINK